MGGAQVSSREGSGIVTQHYQHQAGLPCQGSQGRLSGDLNLGHLRIELQGSPKCGNENILSFFSTKLTEIRSSFPDECEQQATVRFAVL